MRRKKIEPLMDTGNVALDAVFNAGWENFVNEIRDENDRCNYRLLRMVEKIKGPLFVTDLKVLLKRIEFGRLRVVKSPIGILVKDNRFATIPEVWVDQRSGGYEMNCSVCIQVKPNRWIVAYY